MGTEGSMMTERDRQIDAARATWNELNRIASGVEGDPPSARRQARAELADVERTLNALEREDG